MRTLPRALLRVLGATGAALAILLGLAAMAVTQPTFRALSKSSPPIPTACGGTSRA